jgi:hypothetical protein
MTVYGVWSGYEDMDGIFSTKEKAEEYVRKEIESKRRGRAEFSILDYVVDAGLDES